MRRARLHNKPDLVCRLRPDLREEYPDCFSHEDGALRVRGRIIASRIEGEPELFCSCVTVSCPGINRWAVIDAYLTAGDHFPNLEWDDSTVSVHFTSESSVDARRLLEQHFYGILGAVRAAVARHRAADS